MIAGLSLASVGVLWVIPGEVPRLDVRYFGTLVGSLAAVVFLLLWVLTGSGWRWWFRLVPILVLLGMAAAIQDVQFTGDMRPMITWRGQPRQVEVVKAAREKQPPMAAAANSVVPTELSASDWPSFRGPNRDGLVLGYTLETKWGERAPRELWRQPCGGGYASFAVAGAVAVTIEQRGDFEVVVCYDADTGAERWTYEHPSRFWEALGGEGPRATPVIADGDVYSLGANGHLVRLDGKTGKPKWSVDILQDNANLTWGMAGSPLVYDDLIVVAPGAQTAAARGRAVLAYDRATGQLRWSAGDHQGGYSSPVLARLGEVRQVLVFDGSGISGYDAQGKGELWRHPWPVQQGINVAQPVVIDDQHVFISSGYGVGCALLRVGLVDGKWMVNEVWKNTNLKCKFTSPVRSGPNIIGLDEGVLTAVHWMSGQRQWRSQRLGHGQVLMVGQHVLVQAEDGRLVVVPASGAASGQAEIKALTKGGKTWNNPAFANGRVYLRNHEEMVCYELPGTRGPAISTNRTARGAPPAGARPPGGATRPASAPSPTSPATPTPPATGPTPPATPTSTSGTTPAAPPSAPAPAAAVPEAPAPAPTKPSVP
jgi:outer membrane protein assembly factor BamB